MRSLQPTVIATFALLLCSLPIRAANPAIAVGSAVSVPQGGALVDVPFVSTDQAITGLQFDIRYQPQAFSLTASAGSASGIAGKTLYTSNPQPDVLRVLIIGLNQTPISSGVIATLSVQVKAGATFGVYSLAVENTAATDGSERAVDLSASDGSVTVAATAAGPVVAAVANAASYATGAVAPGEMVVIYGSLLGGATIATMQVTTEGLVATTLAGTRVLFDGVSAPLLYTTENQVSAIVPYGLDGHAQTSLQVEYQGIQSVPFVLPVTKAAPGIFTADSSGRGQGAIVNQDGTINTPDNPASSGSLVSIYGTGDGQTLPAGKDGIIISGAADLRYTLLPVTASIGGQTADVVYAGSVGGEVAGIFQANVRVPKDLPSGTSLPVNLTVGSSGSQTGVTIAVQ
jgi:uncharacterized protein (TIGR03437 family)